MPVPSLLNGVLPPGTYQATLNEVWAIFDQPSSATRPDLNKALQHASALIWSVDAGALIYLDGSYVTSKIDPIDVDLAARSDFWDDATFAAAFSAAYPGEERLVDFFFNLQNSPQHMEDVFRDIQGSSAKKGVIQLLP